MAPAPSIQHARAARTRELRPLALAAALASLCWGCSGGDDADAGPPPDYAFVGGAACAECHEAEAERWRGSDHDKAMAVATEETVLGDFDDAELTHAGVTSRFFRSDGDFVVRTDGPDGELADFVVTHTFGLRPLQQYLVAFPGGRYQVLRTTWDSRPAEDGGQRWFVQYPDEPVPHYDILHWTGPNQNWNFMCAECHSTDLRTNYNVEADRYDTTWAEINVSCEACHGRGSEHVAWAREERGDDGRKGLELLLREPERVPWRFDPDTGVARRTRPRTSHAELETCARCHSRRGVLWPEYEHGRPLLDTHRLSLLADGLYHADGQIRDEVYVYGSMLQSRMHAAGVTCSDCHDPHSLEIASPVDTVCARCHAPEVFAQPGHHHHEPGTEGASCVACHSPETTYMVVDPRRDHSFRVPRPDLSVELGTPNACSGCHDDHGPRWALDAVREWYPDGRSDRPHYAHALHAGRRGAPEAEGLLAEAASDPTWPAIVRATALAELGRFLGERGLAALRRGLADEDALVRLGATEAFAGVEPRAALPLLAPLLSDPVRAVRQRAASVLAPLREGQLPTEHRAAFTAALEEYLVEQRANAERGGAHVNLGNFHLERGDLEAAEDEYQLGIAREPRYGPSYANLADLYRREGREREAEEVLRRGIGKVPEDAGLHHALGLLLVRAERWDEAIDALQRAVQLDPASPRHAYVLGLALERTGEREHALQVMRDGLTESPWDAELLGALVKSLQAGGEVDEALVYARRLARLLPGDPGVAGLVRELEAAQR